jgi:hypothetical protein
VLPPQSKQLLKTQGQQSSPIVLQVRQRSNKSQPVHQPQPAHKSPGSSQKEQTLPKGVGDGIVGIVGCVGGGGASLSPQAVNTKSIIIAKIIAESFFMVSFPPQIFS